jgi:hypothetical protein
MTRPGVETPGRILGARGRQRRHPQQWRRAGAAVCQPAPHQEAAGYGQVI